MQAQISNIPAGSIICDPLDTTRFFRIIEHITIFDGHDIGYGYGENDQYAYGETKRIARCRSIESGKIYRFQENQKFYWLEGPNRDKSHLPLNAGDGTGINGAGPIKGHW